MGSMSSFKEQEVKINEVVTKTKDILNFFHTFKQFEDKIDRSVSEL
jgi:hypothetical protein